MLVFLVTGSICYGPRVTLKVALRSPEQSYAIKLAR